MPASPNPAGADRQAVDQDLFHVTLCLCLGHGTRRLIGGLDISAQAEEKTVHFLSGSNQQTIVIARWLIPDAQALIFDEPTQGIAIGAKIAICKLRNELTHSGKSSLFITALADLIAFRRPALTFNNGSPIFSPDPALEPVFYGKLFSIPLPFFYLVFFCARAGFILSFTKPGREIYAVGGTPTAAVLTGITVRKVQAMTIVIVQNGLNRNAAPSSVQNIVLGAIVLLAVGIGKATALAFAHQGARVLVHGLTQNEVAPRVADLSRGMAELAKGTAVQANAVLPGPTWTGGADDRHNRRQSDRKQRMQQVRKYCPGEKRYSMVYMEDPFANVFELYGPSCDPFLPGHVAREHRVELVSKQDLLARSDQVLMQAPMTPDTRHVLSGAEFAPMKPGAILVNTGRGPTVDNKALHRALTEGRLAAAGPDTFACGELMGGPAQTRGIRAMIVDGAGRDTDELEDIN